MQPTQWLPLTEYALRSGMSISTLRRKIKANSVEYRMEDGRYLIRFEEEDGIRPNVSFASTDAPRASAPVLPATRPTESKPFPAPNSDAAQVAPLAQAVTTTVASLPTENLSSELKLIQSELDQMKAEGSLRSRALEARIVGIAKKLETFTEQVAELKMLVKIFEEKLDARS